MQTQPLADLFTFDSKIDYRSINSDSNANHSECLLTDWVGWIAWFAGEPEETMHIADCWQININIESRELAGEEWRKM